MTVPSSQPLHPTIIGRIDPQYEAFYNSVLASTQSQNFPLSELKKRSELIPGGSKPLLVGQTFDFSIERSQFGDSLGPGSFHARCFVPFGTAPESGWPVVLYLHSGGWVLGNIDTENNICTQICNGVNCVVITPDYRLAPENRYPAAEEDAWATALWIQAEGKSMFNLDLNKVSIVGCSAGGNLTAAICQRMLSRQNPLNFRLQVLVAPVLDHTASVDNNESWAENAFTPGLPPEKVLWYRNHYLPDQEKWKQASPLSFDGDLGKLPQTFITVGELDVLRAEGKAYADKLASEGVEVSFEAVPGVPHGFFGMDKVLKSTRDCWDRIIIALQKAMSK